MKLGFIGTGTITTAVVHGLAGRGHQIAISERSASRAKLLADTYQEVTRLPNQQVIDASDVVFIALLAEAAQEILEPLSFRTGQRVISFMAGMSLDELATLVAPATADATVLPFPSIAGGGSPLLCLGDRALVDQIFGETETVVHLRSDADLQAYLCAQAVLSPVARLVDDAARWLANNCDDHEQGDAFLRALVASNFAQSSPAELIEALNTEGGFNQRLRLHMETAGMREDLNQGLDRLATET